MSETDATTLGGGCFWCLEAVFEMVLGVSRVKSGYTGGSAANPSYKQVCKGTTGHAEVVQIDFNPDIISFRELLEIFFVVHDPTTLNRQGNDVGNNYRSALYWTTEAQRDVAFRTKDEFQALLNAEGYGVIVTEMKPLEKFWPAEDYHQDFLLNNPYGYCPEYSTGVAFEKIKIEENDFAILKPLFFNWRLN